MNARAQGDARTAFVALASTLAIQIYISFAATAAAVLAPEIASTFGVEARWIGVFIGLVYAGGMFASLASGGFIERFGPIRISQACVVFAAVGVLIIVVAPSNSVAWVALAAIVIGLGYGPVTPASSHLLQRTAPPSRMALTFSIKQTGVPAGAAIAGAILPAVSLAIGWREAFALVSLFGLVVVASAQPVRAALDADRGGRGRFTMAGIFSPLSLLRDSRALLELALVSFVYSATQVCLTTFLVVHLTQTLGWSLVAAGLALTAATVGGVAGRIGWGYVADRWLSPRRVLTIIGLLAGLFGACMVAATPAWPKSTIIVLATLFGITAIGWNGVQLSEVARLAPPGGAGKMTGASGFVTFAGVVVGPPSFGLLASLGGSYRIGFAAFAFASAGAAVGLIRNQGSGIRDQRTTSRAKE